MRHDDDRFHPRNFESLSAWYAAVYRRGVPTAVPHGIQTVMSGLGIGFHEAFALLLAERELLPAGTGYVIDLAGPRRVVEKHRRG
ncbi:MAG TPA: hypothetical protein VL426_02945 [Candidatus Binatia bacterium]|nr:hypothetical protein [Candidatus Binatia bacterium]